MNKKLIKKLMDEVWKEYDYASILAMDSTGKRYSVSGQGIKACQDSLYCSNGYVIKAYDGKRYVEFAFNELDENKIPAIVENIKNVFMESQNLTEGLYINELGKMSDEKIISEAEDSLFQNISKCGDEYIISRLEKIRRAGLASDERILDCRANAAYQEYYKYFLSPNKSMFQRKSWMSGHLVMLAKREDVIKQYFNSYSSTEGIELLDRMESDIDKISKETLSLLASEQIIPGEYECICSPDVTGMIVHEAFGHGVEMDMFVKNRALAKDYIGKYVASPLVTMHDGAAAWDEVASYDFDDEGMPAKDTIIIDKGILKRGINDAQTALTYDDCYTGNGRRENYEHKVYTRMTNTYFEGGKDKLEDMIKSIKHGYLLDNATCGMEDPKNWGIQCMVNVAKEIVNGQFTGKIYSPIVLSGYVPDLLKSISMMSETPVLCGSGACGKGYKEWVKVSDGGPYIKAKIRLG